MLVILGLKNGWNDLANFDLQIFVGIQERYKLWESMDKFRGKY